jgi:pimeloyl-ACP methyl ester carboxylesterase
MATINLQGTPHDYDLTEPKVYSETIVFIHGWLLSRCYWQPLIERLSADYRCLAYDLRGFGRSQSPDAGAIAPTGSIAPTSSIASMNTSYTMDTDYTLAAYARDLALLLKELDISSVWLLGHSLGGSIALWSADLLPEQVKGVICLNAGGGIYLKEEFERFRSLGKQLVKLRPRWFCRVPLLEIPFTRDSVVKPIDRRWARQRLLDFLAADPKAALGTLLESTTEAEVHRLPQIVARLQQPVYFIAGAQDSIMEPKYVHHLASYHPLFEHCGANVTEIPNCGHLAMLEQPAAVVDRIQAILTQHATIKPIAEQSTN